VPLRRAGAGKAVASSASFADEEIRRNRRSFLGEPLRDLVSPVASSAFCVVRTDAGTELLAQDVPL